MLTKQDIESAVKYIKEHDYRTEHDKSTLNQSNYYWTGFREGIQAIIIHLSKSNPNFNHWDFLDACEQNNKGYHSLANKIVEGIKNVN